MTKYYCNECEGCLLYIQKELTPIICPLGFDEVKWVSENIYKGDTKDEEDYVLRG